MDKRTDPIGIGDLFADIPALFLPLFDGAEYPWEILPRIKDLTARLAAGGLEG